METTENQRRFAEYYQLSDQLMDVAEKDVLMEVARILAIHVSHYGSKYGKVSMDPLSARGGPDCPHPGPTYAGTFIAPLIMTEALFAASCNDFDDKWL